MPEPTPSRFAIDAGNEHSVDLRNPNMIKLWIHLALNPFHGSHGFPSHALDGAIYQQSHLNFLGKQVLKSGLSASHLSRWLAVLKLWGCYLPAAIITKGQRDRNPTNCSKPLPQHSNMGSSACLACVNLLLASPIVRSLKTLKSDSPDLDPFLSQTSFFLW